MQNGNRYNFASLGGSAVDEMTRLLAERETRQRQAFLDSITQREMSLREQTEARQADYQTKAFEDAALNRESVRADRVYDDLMPRDAVDPATAALLRKHGRGGGLRDSGEGVVTPEQMLALDQQRVAQVEASPTGEADLSDVGITPAVAPGIVYSERGGPKYAAARVAADERAAQAGAANLSRETTAAANRTATAEKAAADREFKLLIAQMQNSTNAGQKALANELTSLRIDAERTKQETAATDRTKSVDATKATTQGAYDAVSRMLDPRDVGGNIGAATGAYEMRGITQGAQDFNAVRDQAVAALTQPNLGLLKGPMSDKDIVFVKQLATRLGNRNMSEAETRRALTEAQQFLVSKGAASPMGAPLTGAPPAGGKPLTARNPTTGETLVSDDGGKTWHK